MGTQTILIVDDEPSVSKSLELVLEEKYSLLFAGTAIEGLTQLKEHPEINLLLLDIRLPGMDGISALTEIRKIRNDLPIAILTAGRSDEVHNQAEVLGVDDYILKPFEIPDLLERVSRLLAK